MDQKLETFLTLCKTMHYGRAAELLHLSQPAVSKHIQALEAQYGVRLFTYQARRLQKTREGDLLEQYAFSLRYNEEMLLARLHEKSKTLLRIGATKSIGDYILLPEIRRFLAKPDQQLHFLVDNTAHLLAKLEDGELDFVVLEGLFDKQRYDFFLLREEPYLGICAADHPFAGKQIPIPDLFSERLILREEGSGTRKILERELTQSGYHVSAFSDCACISSFKLLKELVRENCGISFVYEAVVKDDPRFGRFFCPPLTGAHELNVVYLKNTGIIALWFSVYCLPSSLFSLCKLNSIIFQNRNNIFTFHKQSVCPIITIFQRYYNNRKRMKIIHVMLVYTWI